MKAILSSLLLALATTAHARIGETLDECQARYGVMVRVDVGDYPQYPQYIYHFHGVEIRVRLLNGLSAQEHFSGLEGKLTDSQQAEIVRSNTADRKIETKTSYDFELGMVRVMTAEFDRIIAGNRF